MTIVVKLHVLVAFINLAYLTAGLPASGPGMSIISVRASSYKRAGFPADYERELQSENEIPAATPLSVLEQIWTLQQIINLLTELKQWYLISSQPLVSVVPTISTTPAFNAVPTTSATPTLKAVSTFWAPGLLGDLKAFTTPHPGQDSPVGIAIDVNGATVATPWSDDGSPCNGVCLLGATTIRIS